MSFHNHYEWKIGNDRSNRAQVNSNQKDVERLSTSFFVTNFPRDMIEKDLWRLFDEYAKVVDVYIARKISKLGKKFAFVHFLKIADEKRLESKLVGIWVGNFHLFVSMARFNMDQKSPKPSGNIHKKDYGPKQSANMQGTEQVHRSSYVDILHRGNGERNQVNTKASKTINLVAGDFMAMDDSSRIILCKVRYAYIIPQLYSLCNVEGFVEVNIKFIGGRWVWFQFLSTASCVQFKQHEGMMKYFQEVVPVNKSFVVKERGVWLEIQGLPLSAWSIIAYKKIARIYGQVLFDGEDLDEQLSSGKKIIQNPCSGDSNVGSGNKKSDGCEENEGESQRLDTELSEGEEEDSNGERADVDIYNDELEQFLPEDPIIYNDKFSGIKEAIGEDVSSEEEFCNKETGGFVNSKKMDSNVVPNNKVDMNEGGSADEVGATREPVDVDDKGDRPFSRGVNVKDTGSAGSQKDSFGEGDSFPGC
ncbi:unnamed protein product [Lactuca virosa]|uniref:RRM domain-containing protein n=1 Tax=Lactuca virosa TaxID=75947 RepID=A0AAU9LRK5_9ASTR|nr:unnamed protein product [Lactuca virosa]